MAGKRRGGEGKGRERGRWGGEGKGREGKGREGWEGREMDPRNFENRSTPMAEAILFSNLKSVRPI